MQDINDDNYEPTEEELKEIEEVLKEPAKSLVDIRNRLNSTRRIYTFNSEDHWAGWLRVHGIKWYEDGKR